MSIETAVSMSYAGTIPHCGVCCQKRPILFRSYRTGPSSFEDVSDIGSRWTSRPLALHERTNLRRSVVDGTSARLTASRRFISLEATGAADCAAPLEQLVRDLTAVTRPTDQIDIICALSGG